MAAYEDLTLPELSALLEAPLAPEPVSWLPQTNAWLVLAVLLGVLLALMLTKWIRRRRAFAPRREALRQLALLSEASDSNAKLSELASILRRCALASFPREEVASRSEASWFDYLESRCANLKFDADSRRALGKLAYSGQALPNDEFHRVRALVEHWIRHHHA